MSLIPVIQRHGRGGAGPRDVPEESQKESDAEQEHDDSLSYRARMYADGAVRATVFLFVRGEFLASFFEESKESKMPDSRKACDHDGHAERNKEPCRSMQRNRRELWCCSMERDMLDTRQRSKTKRRSLCCSFERFERCVWRIGRWQDVLTPGGYGWGRLFQLELSGGNC